jgi:hypothetical protein
MSQVVMSMRWAGVTPEQYEEACEIVNWEGEPADGGLFHVASFDDEGLRVTDVWESEEHFNRFVEERLTPGIQQVGIQGQPEVEFHPVQRLFNARVPAAA